MKTFVCILSCAICATAAIAAPIGRGAKELSLSGSFDSKGQTGTTIDLNAQVGYFMVDYVEVGLIGGFSDNEVVQTWSAGVFGELHMPLNRTVIPFIGIGALYGNTEIEDPAEETDSVTLNLTGGSKFFVSENLAVSLAYVFSVANEDIFVNEGQIEDTDSRVELGMRFYF
jgi:opacity protein-like surface antigen